MCTKNARSFVEIKKKQESKTTRGCNLNNSEFHSGVLISVEFKDN